MTPIYSVPFVFSFQHLLFCDGLARYRQLGSNPVHFVRLFQCRQRVEKFHPVDRVASLEGAFGVLCDRL